MQYNFVIIRTDRGGRYARKILRSIKWLNENKYPQHEFIIEDMTISEFMRDSYIQQSGDGILTGYDPRYTIIHARCANPRTDWTIRLRAIESMGYKVVNSVDTIELTSNKLACSLHLQGKVNHPASWEYRKDMSWEEFSIMMNVFYRLQYKYIIAKPLTSLEQGANVKKIDILDNNSRVVRNIINEVPGNKIVIQEYIPYTALHRVIVIGGRALPFTFVDYANDPRKTDWKVSCCLNRTTMKLNEHPPYELLKLAEDTQKEVGGVINFIDIFEIATQRVGHLGIYNYPSSEFTISEINTACSLNIHERLAKQAGRIDWNIHARIARELVKQLTITNIFNI
jgi:glutathione synthase/RimK-type ligase-like ATP-grasp enzyme